MKLAEALNRLKNLKSEAKKVDGYITECVIHFEDDKPDYDYRKETAHRASIQRQIDELKTNIQVTNATTLVTMENGSSKPLAALILLNSSLRADLAFYSKLLETKIEYFPKYSVQ